MSSIPSPLAVMRSLVGTTEAPGEADNPVIVGWGAEVGRRWPEMAEYVALYRRDSTPWCGWAMGYVMARCGIRPPFGRTGTERFMWAESWRDWGDPVAIDDARPGDVVVLRRHVTMLDRRQGDVLICIGGNQSDQVRESRYPVDDVLAVRRAPAVKESLTPDRDDLAGVGRSTDPATATLLHDVPKELGPASIRYHNPGAQYPSREAARFGQLGYGVIGGGHKIAAFPHPVNGAACNLDLLRRRYVGLKIGEAGTKWTGANGFGVPGYDPAAELTAEMVDDPEQAIPLMKAIARREAGRDSPLTDAQWRAAHAMFRAGSADAWLAEQAGPLTSPPNGEVLPPPTPPAAPPITGEVLPPSDTDRMMAEIEAVIRPYMEKRMSETEQLAKTLAAMNDTLAKVAAAVAVMQSGGSAAPTPTPIAMPAPAAVAPAAPKIDLGAALGSIPWARIIMGLGTAGGVAGTAGWVDPATLTPILVGLAGAFGISISGPTGKIITVVLKILLQALASSAASQPAGTTTTATPAGDQAKGSIG